MVEHEPERDAGALRHRASGGLVVPFAEKRDERVGDAATRALAPGDAAVGGRFIREREHRFEVGQRKALLCEIGLCEVEPDAPFARSAGRCRGARSH